jgi:Leucine-rich repeat (LRR) protein
VSLVFNQFEGTIPPGLGGFPGLRHLDLAFNRLSGEPPRSLYNLSSLEVFQLQGNMLHGEIPDDIGSSFPSLWVTSVASNQFTSFIPESLSNLNALKLLDFTDNRFSGHVPPTLGRLPALQRLLLAINRLQADDRGVGIYHFVVKPQPTPDIAYQRQPRFEWAAAKFNRESLNNFARSLLEQYWDQ